ncbi:Seed maturation protein [Melia azedarach]|uniref:Seed maturation protein n=2 Tax=Melia azedarach TaxID=155640 RepID=A0ACC1YZU7_MELAZ|nr:Seed maturation protein [Melia azedarach]KAJ4728717.1 Seed maturation protein [Melia azedarach]
MQTIKEKVSNAASSGKAHADIYKAKTEEKAEKAVARTEEEKEIAHQVRKAKEAKAKMELHQAKAEHAAEKLRAKQSRLVSLPHDKNPQLTAMQQGQNEAVVGSQGQPPVGTETNIARTTIPAAFPVGKPSRP